ncbi:MAG: IPTL-CTERM sorting domain-containing protein [Gammaproteobacteria bacterium]|jgi:hypothetical protein|nr:IPTL-CTERM sorting domain-containing protein [Gammaproteobacteria bacterium]
MNHHSPALRALLFWLCALFGLAAHASTFSVLLDRDRDPATGCSVTAASGGPVKGVDVRLDVVVDGTPPFVTAGSFAPCGLTSGTFGSATALPAGIPVGLNLGVAGSDVIEFDAPLAALGLTPGQQVDLTVTALDVTLASFVQGTAPGTVIPRPPTPIPTLSEYGLLALALLLAVLAWRQRHRHGWVASVMLLALPLLALAAYHVSDGQIGDWAGESPITTSPPGDTADGSTDVRQVFMAQEGGRLFFRIDVTQLEAGPTPVWVQARGPASALEGQTVSMTASASGGTGPVSYAWTQKGGPSVGTITDANTASPTFTAPTGLTTPATLTFEVKATSGASSATAQVQIVIQPDGIAVSAGNDFNANPGQLFTLHAIGTCLTPATTPTPIACTTGDTYSWRQVAPAPGDAGYLDYGIDGSTSANPQPTVPIPTTNPANMVFEVTYTGNGKTATDQVAVFVRDPQPTLPNGPLVVSGARQQQPLTMAAPLDEAVPFSTTSPADSVRRLTARASGGDGNYRYLWEMFQNLTDDPDCEIDNTDLVNADTATVDVPLPVFEAGNTANCNDPDVVYGLLVFVRDQGTDPTIEPLPSGVNESLDAVYLTASPAGTYMPLTVSAPPRQVTEGQILSLSATASGGTPAYSYAWTQTGGPSVGTITGANTATPTIKAPAVDSDTDLLFKVTVTDNSPDSTLCPPDQVSPAPPPCVATRDVPVTVRDTFALAPAQKLRLQPLEPITALSGDTLPLAVGYSGGTLPIATWAWTETTSTGAVITGPATATPTVTLPPNPGPGNIAVTLQVTATDSSTPSAQTASETVQITVTPPIVLLPLAAAIVQDQHTDEGAATNLHVTVTGGSGSYTYLWRQTGPSATGGGLDPKFAVTLSGATTATASFIAPLVSGRQPLSFEVQVTDGATSFPVPVTVVVNDISPTIVLASNNAIAVTSGDTHRITGLTPQGGKGPLTYAWTQTAPATPAATINQGNTLNPEIVFPTVTAQTAFTFELTVTDALGNTAKVTQSFTVQPTVPVAAPALPKTIPGKPGVACYTCGKVGAVVTGNLQGYEIFRGQYDPGAVEKFEFTDPVNPPCSRIEIVTRHEERCPDEKPYCMNDIYQQSGQPPNLWKRCVNEATCHQLWFMESSDKVACFQYDSSTFRDDLVCHLCCYGERCNANALPPTELLYAP